MPITHSGPVTYGQLSVIRSLPRYERAGQGDLANLIHVWPVPPGCSVAEVSRAWFELAAAHESLRSTYDLAGRGPVQQVHSVRPRLLDTVELERHDQTTAEQAGAALAAGVISIENELPWRVLVATVDDEPAYLLCALHHVAADNGAAVILGRQLSQLLEGELIPPQVQPLAMAERQHAESVAATAGFWAGRWSTFDARDRDDDDTSTRRRAAVYRTASITEAAEIARATRTSVQSVVLTLGACLVGHALGRSSLTIGLMAANRMDEESAGLVTSLNQCVPITIDLTGVPDLRTLIRQVHMSCLTGYLNGSFDVDSLARELGRAGITEPDPTFFSKHFNFPGEIGEEPALDAAVRTGVEWRPSGQRSGPNLHLVAATGRGLYVGVGASEALLPDQLPAEIALAIIAGLSGLADGSLGATTELTALLGRGDFRLS